LKTAVANPLSSVHREAINKSYAALDNSLSRYRMRGLAMELVRADWIEVLSIVSAAFFVILIAFMIVVHFTGKVDTQ
jgi:DNA polymerase elongation subunit (family B)